jgi:hypothetical protein
MLAFPCGLHSNSKISPSQTLWKCAFPTISCFVESLRNVKQKKVHHLSNLQKLNHDSTAQTTVLDMGSWSHLKNLSSIMKKKPLYKKLRQNLQCTWKNYWPSLKLLCCVFKSREWMAFAL